MRRGNRKLRLIAAHSVTTKKPSLRSDEPHPGVSCRSGLAGTLLVVQVQQYDAPVGHSVLAGCAYGLLGVTHPPMFWVSYWYQSTASVTGITGTSASMTFCELVDDLCAGQRCSSSPRTARRGRRSTG